jgi:hypothetical protein
METTEISIHQLKIFEFVRDAPGWVSIKDISTGTSSARKTVDVHCRRFVSLGVFDQAEVWPGHRYRVSEMASKRNGSIMERLRKAAEVFGIAHGI